MIFVRTCLLILTVACAGSPTAPSTGTAPSAPVPTGSVEWSLELTTDGGITGRGQGNVRVDSRGTVAVRTMAGNECNATLAAIDLAALRTLVTAADPARWAPSYTSISCCDLIGSTLTLKQGTGSRSATWMTEPLPMPRDLAALAGKLEALRAQHGDC